MVITLRYLDVFTSASTQGRGLMGGQLKLSNQTWVHIMNHLLIVNMLHF